jgi:hypothetical protein
MTGFDEAQDQTDYADTVDEQSVEHDDYPVGSVASPTRTRL